MYLFNGGLFYPYALRPSYEQAGTWPEDGVDVDDAVYLEFTSPRDGKAVGVGEDGGPIWVDAPEPALTYAQELSTLNSAYTADRDALCAAWLRAAVADGMNEGERKADVESELNELDSQHAADVASLKIKYGVE